MNKPMNRQELVSICTRIWGKRWRKPAWEYLGISQSWLRAICNTDIGVPNNIAKIMNPKKYNHIVFNHKKDEDK